MKSAVLKNIFIVLAVLFWTSCNVKPEPLMAGKDICSSCKMPVSDIRFGAEIITTKGKIYKFDDLHCLVDFLKNEMPAGEKAKEVFTVNYSKSSELIHADESFFLVSNEFRTPMNGSIASFISKQEAESFQKNFPGKILSWEQIQQSIN